MYADRLFNALEKREPAPGTVLLSAPGAQRTATLIIGQNGHYTLGVDLTVRSEVPVFNLLPEWHEVAFKPQAFFVGGPHENNAVFAIAVLGDAAAPTDLFQPFGPQLAQVAMGADPNIIKQYAKGVRFFSGHQRWETHVVQEEVAAGEWYVAPALAHDVMSSGDVWGEIMHRQEMPLPLYATFPSNLFLN
ncbi:YqgE/AlgH family protein [Corynebacterium incognita]|uniref:YqgE/AlgH family protein n=1 Tax=Corynebacterium incognita TaxID=2754725 RepID=A0A7G7CLY8_9CORY|nr:YqgE/AlgH family protein [Corynebacterium incognita]QNE88604.1 YqgE/AlgH family protein [Corynebacterium incognita]